MATYIYDPSYGMVCEARISPDFQSESTNPEIRPLDHNSGTEMSRPISMSSFDQSKK